MDAKYFSVFATVDIGKYLTSFGKNHIDDIYAIISDLLNRDYQLSNTNFIYKMYKFEDGEISILDNAGTVGGEHILNLYILESCSIKQLDKYLWQLGSELRSTSETL